MRRVVLDTNVLVSGFTHLGSVPAQLLLAWLAGRFELVLSAPIFDELAHTFEKPYFRERLSAQQIILNLDLLRRRGLFTSITAVVQDVATHPEDDLVLATAVSGTADYLVTGDRQLQALGTYEDVTILSPRAFLDLLNAPDPA
jgi:uncharacterized protein